MIFLVLSRAVYQQDTVSMTGFTRPSQLPVASCENYDSNSNHFRFGHTRISYCSKLSTINTAYFTLSCICTLWNIHWMWNMMLKFSYLQYYWIKWLESIVISFDLRECMIKWFNQTTWYRNSVKEMHEVG